MVNTDSFGVGFIKLGGYEIPINLVGKGISKARKKARGVVESYLSQRESYKSYLLSSKYLHNYKRKSQRARKKARNAAERGRRPQPAYSRQGYYSRTSSWNWKNS